MASSSTPALTAEFLAEDRTAMMLGVLIFLLVWSTIMVGCRLWTRGVIIKQLGLDDYICVVALFATYGSSIATAHMTKYGLGRHVYVMDMANVSLYLRDFYVSIVMYCTSLLFLKLTFLFQYYRILAVQRMRNVYIGCIIFVGGWSLSQVFVGIFTCNPVAGFWDSSLNAKCIPNIPQWYINAAGNIITDVIVFVLPLPALWSLNLAKKNKLVLIGIFGLGFFTVIISIIRIRYLKLFEDFTWETVDSMCWSCAELSSAITCACLPTLRPLVGRYFPTLAATQQIGYSPKGYIGEGRTNKSRTARGGTVELGSDLHSGRRASGGGQQTRGGSKGGADDASVSLHGSEVELAQQPAGNTRRSNNPFEVHVVREVTVAEENGVHVAPGARGYSKYTVPPALRD